MIRESGIPHFRLITSFGVIFQTCSTTLSDSRINLSIKPHSFDISEETIPITVGFLIPGH